VKGDARPPRLARALLRRCLPAGAREWVIGDLDEEYRRYRRPHGRWSSARWYWSQAVRSIANASDTRDIMTPSESAGSIVGVFAGDVRYAVRSLIGARGYTAATLLTLALGVGATVAIFSAVNEVLLRPLPYPDSGRLAMLFESNDERGWVQVHAAPANVDDWRERTSSFTDIGFVNDSTSQVPLGGGSRPAHVVVSQVSGNALSILGVPPLHGRIFREEETYDDDVAVLSYGVWQRLFGGDPAVVGTTVRLDGRSHQVVGVMPREFRYAINDAEVWVPMSWLAGREGTVWFRQAHVVRPIARLRPGVSFEQAADELAAVATALEHEHADTNQGMKAGLTPLKTFLAGDRRVTLLLLLGAVGVLLLVACANVANLTLARAVSRQRELAVRAALGAGRGRLVRQLLTESLVLAVIGTGLGVALGAAGLQAISAVSPPELDGLVFRIDWRLFAFTAGLCALCAVLFGTWPAWRGSRAHAATDLNDGGRGGSSGRHRLLAANGLVAAEVALAVLLVTGAGLMVRSLDQLRRLDPGVDTSSLLTFQIQPPSGAYGRDADRTRLAVQLVEEIEALPGVESAAVTRTLPLTGYGWTSDFTIDAWEPGRFGVELRHRQVTPEYFETMRVPVVQGRMFENSDIGSGRAVPLVVNRAFVARYFPDESPVGRRITFDREPTDRSYWYDIVGVVANERMSVVDEPIPEAISHLVADTPGILVFAVRTAVPPLTLVQPVEAILLAANEEMPMLRPRTMDQVAADSRASERFVMLLLAVFAACALILAAIGVYGVANQAARSRTREVGIRLALGAPGTSIVRALMVRGLLFVGAGMAAGAAGALFGGRLIESMLFRVDPRDPLTLGVVVAVIGVVALGATLVPTWRATRVDPVSVLRGD
jgi:putative ABC transport system permease protein